WRTVEYVGPVAGLKRDRLLGGARAVLYPITEPEPFGLVPVEAMMCGTPVAAVRLGAVSEVVEEGGTGACADPPQEVSYRGRPRRTLDRRRVRERAEARFSARRMAAEYAAVYQRLAAGGR